MSHVKLAGAIALAGLVFTSRAWLQWMHTLGPELGLFVKNLIIFIIILGLHAIDRSVNFHRQAAGIFLVYLAFVMIFNYQSEWIKDARADNVEKQTIDGAVYNRAKHSLNLDPEFARLVTFVIVPFLLVLFGSRLMRDGQLINLDT